MAKPELGTKRVCAACGTRYYDLKRDPITCPNCGTIFEPAIREKAVAQRAAKPPAVVEVETEAVVEREPDVISLEEAEEDAGPDAGPDVDEDEAAIPDADALEIEAEIEPDEAAPFIEDEEEAGDDVAGLLDVDAETEEER